MTIYTLTDSNRPDSTQLFTDMVNDDTCLSSENQTFLYFEIILDWKCVNFGEIYVTTITHRKACQCWIYFYNFFVLWSKFCVIWIHSGVIFLNQTSLFSLSVRVIATMEYFPTNLPLTYIPNKPLCAVTIGSLKSLQPNASANLIILAAHTSIILLPSYSVWTPVQSNVSKCTPAVGLFSVPITTNHLPSPTTYLLIYPGPPLLMVDFLSYQLHIFTHRHTYGPKLVQVATHIFFHVCSIASDICNSQTTSDTLLTQVHVWL